jgi:hypothetical protein
MLAPAQSEPANEAEGGFCFDPIIREGGFMHIARAGVIGLFGVLATSCTLLQLDTLVPTTAVSELSNDPKFTIKICRSTAAMTPLTLARQHMDKIARVKNNTDRVQAALPAQLSQDPVLRSIIANIRYASTNSLVRARQILAGGAPISDDDAAALADAPKPAPVSSSDVGKFAHNVGALVMNAANTPDAGGNPDIQLFWSKLYLYYKAYFSGYFETYFAQNLAKPALSTTITDTEISNAALVFVEFILDEILPPRIWYGADGKYYPAGVKLPASTSGAATGAAATPSPKTLTYLYVNKISTTSLPKISATSAGCGGMTYDKVNALSNLAQQFATAAVAETSLTVKTAGGIEVGLGILGKVNIGDNSTLTNLISTLVTDVVRRLTIEIGAPILESIDLEAVPNPMQPQLVAAASMTGKTKSYAALFKPNGQ